MSESRSTLRLKPGREKPVLRRHPWVYSGAVQSVDGGPQAGETVNVLSAQGQFLAKAAYSPESQIRARLWTWKAEERIDRGFLQRRLEAAIELRTSLLTRGESDAVRLVYAESDGLPGFIADRYGDTLVVQILSCGAEAKKDMLIPLLCELTGLQHVYERSDVEVRELEGLGPRQGWLSEAKGETRLQIEEHGMRYWVDIQSGHKTGFYIDQRRNRRVVREFTEGKDVLDSFAYTGGFTLNALAGGAASVVSIDVSSEALALAEENLALNGLPRQRVERVEGDVFEVLRVFRDERRKFDLVILDPPKFAPTRAQVARAARGYKDINLLAFKLLRPGGRLVTFSCSGGVDEALFQKIVADAALDAGVQAQIVARLSQAEDHPVALNFPEGAYLKGLVCLISESLG